MDFDIFACPYCHDPECEECDGCGEAEIMGGE